MVSDFKALIREYASLESPRFLPEMKLYQATEDLPIYRMGEEELAEIGIGTPFWAFAWAGGQALSRYLLENPGIVAGRRVLDFGAGSGMVAIAAAMAGADHVLASDIDPVARAAMELNRSENGVEFDITTDDLVGSSGDWDILLVGDVCYDKEIANIVMPWVRAQADGGKTVLIGDPGRFYLPKLGLKRIAAYHAPTTSIMEDSDLRNAQVWTVEVPASGSSRTPCQ